MSEQTKDEQPKVDKVTAVEKSEAVKVKDPWKVELGKRLAKISREAKERKARQREDARKQSEVKNEERELTDYVDFGPSALRYFIGGVTFVAALGGLYFAYKKDKREEKEISKERGVDSHEKGEKNTQPSSDKVKKCTAQGFEIL